MTTDRMLELCRYAIDVNQCEKSSCTDLRVNILIEDIEGKYYNVVKNKMVDYSLFEMDALKVRFVNSPNNYDELNAFFDIPGELCVTCSYLSEKQILVNDYFLDNVKEANTVILVKNLEKMNNTINRRFLLDLFRADSKVMELGNVVLTIAFIGPTDFETHYLITRLDGKDQFTVINNLDYRI